MKYDYNLIENKLKDILSIKRYRHTLGVSYTAASLAMKHNVDIDSARVAGLLHDCAKCIDDDEMISNCQQYDLEIREIELESPYLLHGKLGAYYAKNKYGIEEEEILSSIIYHTTGKPDMSPMEMIIFIADYIEPNRKTIPNLIEIRQCAFENLGKTTYLILKNTLSYLNNSSKKMDTRTLEAYEYYKKIYG